MTNTTSKALFTYHVQDLNGHDYKVERLALHANGRNYLSTGIGAFMSNRRRDARACAEHLNATMAGVVERVTWTYYGRDLNPAENEATWQVCERVEVQNWQRLADARAETVRAAARADTERTTRITALVKTSGARCTCGWNNGDHEDRCELVAAWDDAADEVDDYGEATS